MRLASRVALLLGGLGLLAPAADAQVLYWLDTNFGAPTIQRADADGVTLASVPLAPGTLPEGLAVDAGGKVYWTEAAWSNAKLNRAAPTLASVIPLVTGGSVLRGVAVDNVNQRLYWTSSNLVSGAAVHRSALNGNGAVTLIALAPGANPRGIAVDPLAGKIYWADMDQDAIYQANLDGSLPGVWVSAPVGSRPYGVAVSPLGFVYWTEYAGGKLRRATTSATDVTPLVAGLSNPTYLALDVAGGRMYWSEGGVGAQRIQRANLDGTGAITLPSPLTSYGGLAFISDGTVGAPEVELPTEFALDRVWPNPARGPIRVSFALPRETRVRLSVLDLQGREVAVLADGVVPAGRHERLWSTPRTGGTARAGIYFVRFAADGHTWTRRLALVR